MYGAPGQGYPPQQGGYPPQQGGYPPQQGGYPPQQGFPPQQGGYPPQQGGYPPQQGGYPQQQGGYPPQQGGYPPQQGGYPPQQGGYPPQQGGYPPQQGFPPQQGGYPPQQGFPPQQGGYPPQQQGFAPLPQVGAVLNLRGTLGRKFFCCEPNGNVCANRDAAAQWEQLTVVPGARPGTVALRTFHNTFVCAEPSGEVVSNRQAVGEWESLSIEPAPIPGNILLRSCHGGRLIQATAFGDVKCLDSFPDASEVWEVVYPQGAQYGAPAQFNQGPQIQPGARIRLRSRANGRFVCAEPNDTVIVNRETPGEWETFSVEHGATPGTVSFRSHHGRFLCCEPNGMVIANRGVRDVWESFRVEPHQGGVVLRTHHNTLLNVHHHSLRGSDSNPDTADTFDVVY